MSSSIVSWGMHPAYSAAWLRSLSLGTILLRFSNNNSPLTDITGTLLPNQLLFYILIQNSTSDISTYKIADNLKMS